MSPHRQLCLAAAAVAMGMVATLAGASDAPESKAPTASELRQKKCRPQEKLTLLTPGESQTMIKNVDGWEFSHGGKRIRRTWTVQDFKAGIDFFNKVAALADAEGHHPDLHLEGYRNVVIELWTHNLRGLTENDFILAAKINDVPVATRK